MEDLSMFDLQYLEDNFGRDHDLLRDIFKAYAEASERSLSEFQSAIDLLDCEAFAAACHKLKSSSQTVGDQTLATLCDRLELPARNKDIDQLQQEFPELKNRIEMSIEGAKNVVL